MLVWITNIFFIYFFGGAVMGKKLKSKPKGNVPEVAKKPNHEINGIIIIGVSLIFALSIYSDGTGILLKAIKDFLGGLFGSVIYTIPPIVFIYGILVMFQKTEFTLERKAFLLIILFILIAGFVHTNYYDFKNMPYKFDALESKQQGIDYNKLAREFYDIGTEKRGGGLLGGMSSLFCVKLVGIYGSNIILLVGIIVLVVQLTHISFVNIIISTKKASIWVAKVSYRSAVYLKEKKKSAKKEDDLSVNLNGDVFAVKRKKAAKNIDEIEETKNAIPDKIVPVGKEQYMQQEIADIKTNGIKDYISKEAQDNVIETMEIDPMAGNKQYDNYKIPPVSLLNKVNSSDKPKNAKKEVFDSAKKLEDTLQSFGVEARVVEISRGPAVTRYELQPSIGVKVSKIVNLADDIALNLAASGIRIEAPIPGKAAVGIEVPNKEVSSVLLREIIETDKFKNFPSKLAFVLGKDIGGESVVADISKMPHLLIAGATGSGKSVCINSLIISILYKARPDEVKLLMIDPKVVELGVYNSIPHLLIPVVTEPKKAAGALNWAVQEMVSRYKTFAEHGVRDIKGYNVLMKGTDEVLPQIVIIIDELADLMMVAPNDVEDAICRLAQMARAAGMHLVIATQRPSVDVITGIIKANIPSRISFAVSSQVDSRTILDMAGAEKLLGRGDMLFYPVGEPKPIRLQGAFISDKEVESVAEYVKSQQTAEYSEDIMEKINTEKEINSDPGDNDELLPQAIEIIVESGQASVSMLQRRLKVGYARAARLIDQMEARGIIGGFEGSKPRQVLISKEQFYSGSF